MHVARGAGLLFRVVPNLALGGTFVRGVTGTSHGEGREQRQRGWGPDPKSVDAALRVVVLQADVPHSPSSDSTGISGGPVSLQEWKEQDQNRDPQGLAGALLCDCASPITSLGFDFFNYERKAH